MKKAFAILMCIILSACLFSGCTGASRNNAGNFTSNKKLKIVTTVFAAYDFARQVAGNTAEVTLLLPPGAESHSYEPAPKDIIKINNCDVFIYNGGESETWVTGMLKEATDSNVKLVKMMDVVRLVREETGAGMQAEKNVGGADVGFDEHVWASPKNAIVIVNAIEKALIEKNSKAKAVYVKNAETYRTQLEKIDSQFTQVVANAKRRTLVFGDRFPLRYFVDAYGLKYYAAFPGCATETEPSAATVANLIKVVKTQKIPVVFHIELSNEKMADIICEATGAKKMLFNACHNISKADFQAGETYVNLMKQNVAALKEALN